MPATPAATPKLQRKSPAAPSTTAGPSDTAQGGEDKHVRLHITPFNPSLLKVYLGPSVLPLAHDISYHSVETFPEKGYGYVELPEMEAQKLKKKLNGSTLKGSKVRIEDAKPEKRKAAEDAESEDKAAKRARKEKKRKELGVLEGVELPDGRKVKRGWTEPQKSRKDRNEKKDKTDKKAQKDSKYTKEPELLFNAKLTPVAATEAATKDKSKVKKDKKKKNAKSNEVVVHEFEKSSKTPSFLKTTKLSSDPKPAVEYVNGKGWVDEDGDVVEAETGKARNKRVLELVDKTSPQPTTEKKPSLTPEAEPSPKSKSKSTKKSKKQITPPTPSSESDEDSSSVVSSSSEDMSSDSAPESDSSAELTATPPAVAPDAPQMILTPSSPDDTREVHPLEALFKRSNRPTLATAATDATSTPAKGLAPINTSFSFFENNEMEVEAGASPSNNAPATPFTQRDLEWRGLRSAAPTPDTAAIGRRFSFPWRNSSQGADEDGEEDTEAGLQLTTNTKANTSVPHLPGLAEEDEDEDDEPMNEAPGDDQADAGQTAQGPTVSGGKDKDEEQEETEFGKWFFEHRGENNRAWKKRKRDTLKAKRLRDNKRATGGRRV
ncbi:hypothetical protein K491DRAFT_687691 [Lophiostoma macrostomum CBS 122681]|uniref:Uncharacterized protein n=1 Tax=Lophiostoma macrostomum CBS 122681 TaxID=1314788 RepID=A0A6A6TQI6_9PLEO|nr:hypothetical protein K491DRAFT_687691 [Lophiostoma macrostomum CBS 122681]